MKIFVAALILFFALQQGAMAAYPKANWYMQPSTGIRPTTTVIVNDSASAIPISGSFSATVISDTRVWLLNQDTRVVVDGTVPVSIAAYTITASCTTLAGSIAVLCDLGDTFDLIYVTSSDSCFVGFDATTNIGNGDYVRDVMIYPISTRYIWIGSQVAYVYPKMVRVRGLR